MKKLILHFFLFLSACLFAQVGINTTTPNAQLDIRSSNQIAPTATDGMLIPKVDTFPATNPSAAQQGMLVYLTTTVGSNLPGFYYWNNSTVTWIPIGNNNNSGWNLIGNTGTNPATNFIGTTDNTDLVFRRFNVLSGRISTSNTFFGRLSGSVSTATNNTYLGTEAGRDNITGQQNVFIGRRAGTFGTTGSDNIFIGNGAGILNEANQNTFVGSFSGNGNSTSANNSFFGYSSGATTSTGGLNTFIGAFAGNTNTIGSQNTLVGNNSNVFTNSLTNATAIGSNSMVSTSNSLVLGSVNGVNSATSTVNVGIGTTSPLDRLHVVGNIRMVDGNQAAGSVLTSDANGTASWQNASANAWGLSGNTSTNPLINFIGTTDNQDLVFKRNNFVRGRIGNTNLSFGSNALPTNTGIQNVAVGVSTLQSNTTGTNNTAVGQYALRFNLAGSFNTANGFEALYTNNSGEFNTATGPSSLYSNTSGSFNTGYGYGTLGINTTGSQNSAFGYNASVATFNLTNATAIGAYARVGASNSLVLGSISGVNGAADTVNVGIGITTPQERLHVAGRTLLTNGFSADNAALLYQNNTDYMFLGPQSGSSANGGAMALYGTTNASGGNAGGVDFNVPNSQIRMIHTNGSYVFRANSTSGYTATFELNDNGLQFGHNSASRSILFNPNSTERMRLTPTGNLGIGTNNPLEKLHVSGPAGLTAVRIANTSGVGVNSNVALDFFRNTAVNTDWRIYNIGPNLTIGNSGDDLATVNDLYQFQGGRFMPMTDATISLGALTTNRWNTVFASNGTINTSDAREKKNIQNLNYGLATLMQLRPVSFEWKKDDGSGTKIGLIAQELQQVVPEVVRDWDWEEDEQGNRKKVTSPLLGVYYSDLIPVLIKATQEQQVVIEQQQQEIKLLKQQLQEQYKSLLERLEKLETN